MKILAIDDQQLVLLPLEKRLTALGYTVKTETNSRNSLALFDAFMPDLVIADINMPGISGIEVLKYIRFTKKSKIPVMILTGNLEEDTIEDAYNIGVNDYVKKPLSLNEICSRVRQLIGAPIAQNTLKASENMIIQERCVGVVIPCYNEEKRLLSNEFLTFLEKNSGYHLCFVNDGSKDNTLAVLNALAKDRENHISVYNCEKNGGKAEAVRLGMLHMAKREDLDYIGFLDADLSTDLADFDGLLKVIENSNYKVVSGSRIERMGAAITKESSRKIISKTINLIIRGILSMNFKDTQCGAKIFCKDVIEVAFKDKFITQWIFDVEIFKRISNHYGLEHAKTILSEHPLKRWTHEDGSKLSTKDSFKIIGQLFQIAWHYRSKKNTSGLKVKRLETTQTL